jgi:hypothetical protein
LKSVFFYHLVNIGEISRCGNWARLKVHGMRPGAPVSARHDTGFRFSKIAALSERHHQPGALLAGLPKMR